MSRLPSSINLQVQRGATWEDSITYTDDAEEGIDLTGYNVRMQVRSSAGRFGTTTATTLLLELSSAGGSPKLSVDTPAGQTVPCRVNIDVDITTLNAALNTTNARRAVYFYALEAYDGSSPAHVLPIAHGRVTVRGETTR